MAIRSYGNTRPHALKTASDVKRPAVAKAAPKAVAKKAAPARKTAPKKSA